MKRAMVGEEGEVEGMSLMIRVLAGELKGRALEGSPGVFTRPLAAIAKKALFDILGPDGAAGAWLDLFAGTGNVGIEALSRGASSCDFVDQSRAACQVIKANLNKTGLEEQSRVFREDASQALLRLCQQTRYDVVFAGPPFDKGWAPRICSGLEDPLLVGTWQRAIVQHTRKEDPGNGGERMKRVECRRYGDSVLSFYIPKD